MGVGTRVVGLLALVVIAAVAVSTPGLPGVDPLANEPPGSPGSPAMAETDRQRAASTAGESVEPAPATPDGTARSTGNPWGKPVVTVAIANTAAPGRNLTGPVAAAIAFWEGNPAFAAYTVELVLDPDAEDPDIVIRYDESISCDYHPDAIGCAPLLNGDRRVAPPVEVQIRYNASDNRRQVRNTVVHELGHVLGVDHCEEPRWVMAAGCPERVDPAPDVDDRDLAWRSSTLTVYVEYAGVAPDERDETTSQVEHALEYFETRGADRPNVSFTRVGDPWAADITIAVEADPNCEARHPACIARFGRDYDRDGRFEYYTRATIAVGPDTDVEARGWYVGWGLANLLAPGRIPAAFEDAGYEERRSDWWKDG